MQNCPICGSPLREGALFCTECGHKIEAPQPQQQPETTYQQPQQQYQQPQQQYQQPQQQYTTANVPPQQPQPQQYTYGQYNYNQQNQYQQPYQPQTTYNQPPKHPKDSLCTVSLVFGILSLTCLGFIGGIVGLITGLNALKAGPNGKAKAGVICSIISLAFFVISIVVTVIGIATGAGFINNVLGQMSY